MDWTTPLKRQQIDFIARLRQGSIFHCEQEGYHSELTIISGNELKKLYSLTWDIGNKDEQKSNNNEIFVDIMKTLLAREAIKVRLGDLITEIEVESSIRGNSHQEFTVTAYPEVGIQVKAGYGELDTVQWWMTQEEVEQNVVLVCVWLSEEIHESQDEYNLILAGFLPTTMMDVRYGVVSFGIYELLYAGGLSSYLENFTDYISMGNKYLQKEEYQKAIAFYNKGLKITPHNVDGYFNRGFACYKLGDYLGAIEDYSFAIEICPSDANIYLNRGNARKKIGDNQGAIEDYTTAIKIQPRHLKAYNNRGNARQEMGDNLGAIADFTEVLKIDPQDAKVYNNRGKARKEIGDNLGAMEDLTQGIKINSQYALAYYNRGKAFAEIGDYEKAMTDFQVAVEINPSEADFYLERGKIFEIMGEHQEALDDYEKATNIYHKQGNLEGYQQARERISELNTQIE